MTAVQDKKRGQAVATAAARKTRARVAKAEGEHAAAGVRLPAWRELLRMGPSERQRSAGEAEQASAPAARVEQVPTETMEDLPTVDQAAAATLESSRPPPLDIETPLKEPAVAEQEIEPVPPVLDEVPVSRGSAAAKSSTPENIPIMRRTSELSAPPVERLTQARLLAGQSRGAGLSIALKSHLSGLPPPLLGAVSIHTDDAAAGAARCLDADAFTIGTHVYFADGRFSWQSRDGLALLTHELAHVVQYQEGRLAGLPAVSQPTDAVECEADGWAARWCIALSQPAVNDDSQAGIALQSADTQPGVDDGRTQPVAAVPSAAPVLRRATDTARDFFDKSYFAQADEWSSVGSNIDGSLATDTLAMTEAFPTPRAELGPVSQAPIPTPALPQALTVTEQIPEPAADSGQVQAESTAPPLGPPSPGAASY